MNQTHRILTQGHGPLSNTFFRPLIPNKPSGNRKKMAKQAAACINCIMSCLNVWVQSPLEVSLVRVIGSPNKIATPQSPTVSPRVRPGTWFVPSMGPRQAWQPNSKAWAKAEPYQTK